MTDRDIIRNALRVTIDLELGLLDDFDHVPNVSAYDVIKEMSGVKEDN